MRKIQFIALALIGLTVLACEKVEEEEISDVRDRFVGTWNCEENSKLYGNNNYQISIQKDSSTTTNVVIYNFYQLGNATATVGSISTTQEQTITIGQQYVDDFFVSGSGTYTGSDVIELNYIVDDGTELDSITATYIKL